MTKLLALLDALSDLSGLDVDLRLRNASDVELVVSGPLPVPDDVKTRLPAPARMLLPRTIELAPSTVRATLGSSPRRVTLTALDLRLANAGAQSAFDLVGGTPFVLRKLADAVTQKDPSCRVAWETSEGALPLTLTWG